LALTRRAAAAVRPPCLRAADWCAGDGGRDGRGRASRSRIAARAAIRWVGGARGAAGWPPA